MPYPIVRKLAFLLLPAVGLAWADFTGTVADSATGGPLAGVLVRVKDQPAPQATTDAQGRFTLPVSSAIPPAMSSAVGLRWNGEGRLVLSGWSGPLRARLSDVGGRDLGGMESVCGASACVLALPLPASGLFVLDLSDGARRIRFRGFAAGGLRSLLPPEAVGHPAEALAKAARPAATLTFTKTGFRSKEVPAEPGIPLAVRMAPDTSPFPTTGGSGGITCTSRGKSGNYNYCKATLSGIEVKIFEPSDGKPRQLAFYLHGDGADDYKIDSWVHPDNAAWAAKNGVMYVAAMAPNQCSWWRTPRDNCQGAAQNDNAGENADAMDKTIQALGKAYNLYTRQILYCGVSGGSTFLSRFYLSRYGEAHPGALAMNCGGGAAILAWKWSYQDAVLRNRNALLYNWGSEDFLNSIIETGIAAYKNLNFEVTVRKTQGASHCAPGIDIGKTTLDFWGRHLIGGALAKQAAAEEPDPALPPSAALRAAWEKGARQQLDP